SLSEREWRAALDFADHSHITLSLRGAVPEGTPAWVAKRLERNASDNRERLRRLEELYRALAAQLRIAGIEFVALKGLTHCELFGSRPETRPQSDIDLFIPREVVEAARDAVMALGFESLESMDELPTDHLPMLIRKTGWEWRGNFFDPEMPVAVEPHFQFWDAATERLAAPGVEEFWTRRLTRVVAGV